MIDNEPIEKVYNACSGDVYAYYTLAQKVIDISSKTLDIIIEKNGLKHEYSGDNSRLTSEVNDLSFVKIDDAIQNLYHWYSHNTSVIKKELFAY